LSKVIQIIGAKPLVNVRTFHTHVEENCTIIFSMCPKKGQQKHGRIWSSVPKGKIMAKFFFKGSLKCAQTKRKEPKKFKRSPFESAQKTKSKKGTKRS
jgi:hypothetical protein